MFRSLNKTFSAAYYHELARDLQAFGYGIQSNPRGDFQIEGVSKDLCDRFSKRHHQIGAKIQELLDARPELVEGNLKDLREWIAQTERERKVTGIKPEALVGVWHSQLTPDEKQRLLELAKKPRAPTHRDNGTLLPTRFNGLKPVRPSLGRPRARIVECGIGTRAGRD